MWKLAGVLAVGMALVPLVVILAATSGLWRADARSDPPRWETAIAARALQASIELQAPEAASPVPADTATMLAGMKVFQDNCAGCHGSARNPSPYGLAMYPRAPQFGRQPPNLKDYQAFWVILNGIRYSAMAGFHGQMPEPDMWRAAEFVTHLQNLPPDVHAAWDH